MAANDWTQRHWARRRFLVACGSGDEETTTQPTQAPSTVGAQATQPATVGP